MTTQHHGPIFFGVRIRDLPLLAVGARKQLYHAQATDCPQHMVVLIDRDKLNDPLQIIIKPWSPDRRIDLLDV